MREIRFRAWDIERKGYIQGFNMVNYHGYFNKGLKKSIYRYDTKWDEEEYILEQYTGLKDKNGKEIYEGDLLQLITFEGGGGISAFSVEFENGCFGINTNGEYLAELKYYIDMPFISAEIIGNIHENPELLKG